MAAAKISRWLQRCAHLLALLQLLRNVAESAVSYEGRVFESMPANFGMPWSPATRTYQAHLQVMSNYSKLCDEDSPDDGVELLGLVLPKNDSLPVALLVERGNCSFEEKATVAMQAYPAISFVIVHDDQPSKNLVSMRETDSNNGVRLGLLFISYRSGMALRGALDNVTSGIFRNGGPIVQIDGLNPLSKEPSFQNLQTWILIAMGGFFTFITVFGCLLVFVQLGVIPVDGAGQIILSQDARRRSRRLLGSEEVARLQPGGDLHGKYVPEQGGARHSGESASSGSGSDHDADYARNTNAATAETEEEQCCAVCLDELVPGSDPGDEGTDTLCLPCGHTFHLGCIVPWLTERHATCPLCKFDMLDFIDRIDEGFDKEESRLRCSLAWWKEQARRLMGWSPIGSSDSQSEVATSNSDAEGGGAATVDASSI